MFISMNNTNVNKFGKNHLKMIFFKKPSSTNVNNDAQIGLFGSAA